MDTMELFDQIILNINYYKNERVFTIYTSILLSAIIIGITGFLFWFLAAKLYPDESVGIAVGIISAMNLIITMSRFGYDQSIIRFFPEFDHEKILGTAIGITTITAFIIAIIAVLSVEIWSPELIVLKEYFWIFALTVCINSFVNIACVALVTLHLPKEYFIQNSLLSSRIIFLFAFVFIGCLGIFLSLSLSFILAGIFILYVLFNNNVKHFLFDISILKKTIIFSFGNYLFNSFLLIPSQILPIIVLSMLGPSAAAVYYIDYTIAAVLFIIPTAFATSLFVEGSYGESIRKILVMSVLPIGSLLFISILGIFLFGPHLLSFFGQQYTDGINLLKLFAISSIFVGIFQVSATIKKIQKDVKTMVFMSALLFLFVIGISYLLLPVYGLDGIGYAWIISYAAMALLICCQIIWGNRSNES